MRVFIALDIAEGSKKELISIQSQFKETSLHCKWVDLQKHAHLTLRFWADINDNQLGDIKSSIDVLKESFKPVDVLTSDISSYSQLKKNQVLWFSIEESFALENIYDLLSAQLEIRAFEHEEREFLPHITLGRLKSRKGLNDYKAFAKKTKVMPLQIKFESLSLYKSTLTDSGPVYELLHRI